MVKIRPFAAVRPPKQYVEEVAARPYDVLNSAEAKAEAGEKSLLHITKPEIDFDPIIDEHSQPAYDKAVENFRTWQEKGWLVQDDKPYYYVYAQTMDGRTQYGLVMCALLCSHEGCSRCTVVTVSYIECRNLRKDLCDAVNVSLVIHNPEMMSESIFCDEVIFSLLSDVLSYDRINLLVVGI